MFYTFRIDHKFSITTNLINVDGYIPKKISDSIMICILHIFLFPLYLLLTKNKQTSEVSNWKLLVLSEFVIKFPTGDLGLFGLTWKI